MTAPVTTRRIVDALERDGLLIGVHGALPEQVQAITADSRAVTTGTLFVAVRGQRARWA